MGASNFSPERIPPIFPPLDGEDEGGVGALFSKFLDSAQSNRKSRIESREKKHYDYQMLQRRIV
jgi:hypothetical protein